MAARRAGRLGLVLAALSAMAGTARGQMAPNLDRMRQEQARAETEIGRLENRILAARQNHRQNLIMEAFAVGDIDAALNFLTGPLPPPETEEQEQIKRLRAKIHDYSLHYGARPDRVAADLRQNPPGGPSQAAALLDTLRAGGGWHYAGPANLAISESQWQGRSPLAGRVNDVACDPHHPNVYYVATATGGLWKVVENPTDPSKISWKCLSDFDPTTGRQPWDTLDSSCVVVDPNDSLTLYVGTGDFDDNDYVRLSRGIGILKSEDGGATWSQIGEAGMRGYAIRRMMIDPSDSKILLATTGRHPDERTGTVSGKVWRSCDGGACWQELPIGEADWCDLVYSLPYVEGGQTRRHLYAAGQGPNHGRLWRSDDQGAHWIRLELPLTGDRRNADWQEGLRIAPSATDPHKLYLVVGDHLPARAGQDPPPIARLYVSTTRGTGWLPVPGALPDSTALDNWAQINFDLSLTCSRWAVSSAATRDVLYLGARDLSAAVIPSGAPVPLTWVSVGHVREFRSGRPQPSSLHADQHSLTVLPTDPNRLLAGCDGGVYLVTFLPPAHAGAPPQFQTSSRLNAGLAIAQCQRASFHPGEPTHLDQPHFLAGLRDNATAYCAGGVDRCVGAGDGAGCFIDLDHPDRQYVTAYNDRMGPSIYFTDGAWNRWDTSDLSMNPVLLGPDAFWKERFAYIAALAADPERPGVFYTAGSTLYNYYLSPPLGTTGSPGVPALQSTSTKRLSPTDVAAVCMSIASEPTASALARFYCGMEDNRLVMTDNFQEEWKPIQAGQVPLPGAPIAAISVNPADPHSVIVGLGRGGVGHLWLCADTTQPDNSRVWKAIVGPTDSAENQRDALPDVPVNAIARDPDDPLRTLYVGTDAGVFLTTDGGEHWVDATVALGMPRVRVNDLQAVPGTGYLYAASYGRGMWRIRLPSRLYPTALRVDSPSTRAGQPITCTVTLSGPAPAGGAQVFLASTLKEFAFTSHAWVRIPENANSASFRMTAPAGNGTLTAFRDGKPISILLNITP